MPSTLKEKCKQKKETSEVRSANLRELRKKTATHCPICGFRDRGGEHVNGEQHQAAVNKLRSHHS